MFFFLGSFQAVDERVVMMGFQQWLAGVTERIHQTMHYKFDGKVEVCVVKSVLIKGFQCTEGDRNNHFVLK